MTSAADARVLVLVINLDDCPDRWERLAADLVTRGAAVVRRVAATDGRSGRLPPDALALASVAVRRALGQRWRECNRFGLTTPEAVACSHSHWRCWQWFAYSPDVRDTDAMLVLEDDAAFVDPPGTPLGVTLASRGIEPVRLARDAVDFVQLGWMPQGNGIPAVDGTTSFVGPFPTDAHHAIYGSHCYLVPARAGARRLMDAGVPFQLHLDFFLSVGAQLGRVRGLLLRPSCCRQSMAVGSGTIPHFEPDRMSYKIPMPDAPLVRVCGVLGVAVLAVIVAIWVGCVCAHALRGKKVE